MELRQLQYLVACAQTESFSHAAIRLYTSQSNVSKTIAALEKEIGKKLFDRKQHGIVLTETGKKIYKYALSMMEFSEKIMDCAEEDDHQQLCVSFQPSTWFASAFCEYYKKNESNGLRYRMTSAPVEEIIRRITNNLDQIGFAYFENSQLSKMQDIFRSNHINYLVLKQTRTVLYKGQKAKDLQQINENENLSDDESENTEAEVIELIQGSEDYYSGISNWKTKSKDGKNHRLKVVITTNSDNIMRNILKETDLCNISPEYLSHGEASLRNDMEELEHGEMDVQFICMFRNDRAMEKTTKDFLSFIRKYIEEK